MGKHWDSTGIANNVEMWGECLRVLKPGGHLLAFSGTRTYHRMASAIEDAGFEVRDMVEWVYGCLSEDTEILTSEGWKQYHKDIVSDSVLCYDIENGTYEYHKPTDKFFYQNEHTAYRITSDTTDQIVSRNHRVLVERGGRKVFVEAETLERQEIVPILESLSELPDSIYDAHKGTGTKKSDLLKRVCEQSNRGKEHGQEAEENQVQGVQKDVLPNWTEQEQAEDSVLKEVQRGSEGARMEEARSQGEKELETRKRTIVEGTNDRRDKSSVEGWSDIQEQEGQVCKSGNQVCEVSEGVSYNGSERRVCNGAQAESSTGDTKTTDKDRVCTPHQPRCNGQQDRKPNTVQDERGTQEVRTRSGYTTTLATVEPIDYSGKVWCVTVPTGAFVARRNGKIFITGNSGFPKSLNIGKSVNRLETNEWSKISKAFDNIDQKSIMEVWKKNAKLAGIKLVKNLTGVGSNTRKKYFVHDIAVLYFNQEKENASAITAELNLCVPSRTSEENLSIAVGSVEQNTELSQELVKSVVKLSENQRAKSWNIFTAQCDVKEWLSENTEVNHKADEALKTLRGNKKYSNEEIINVLCVALTDTLKLTILNQSKTFQNLGTNQKMECVSAINVIITEYTAENLISNTVAILKSKAVDKLQGNEREWISESPYKASDEAERASAGKSQTGRTTHPDITKGTSEWEGWGTALKPAHEPICMARKPLSEKTVAENCLKWGTGGINIDESRVDYNGEIPNIGGRANHTRGDGYGFKELGENIQANTSGRFPANLILSFAENEYIIKENITNEQKQKALKWIYENA